MVKLTNRKIAWAVRSLKKKESTTGQVAELYGVSRRRVRQLAKEYSVTGTIPKLDQSRRPKTFLNDAQIRWIEEAWKETRLDSRLLYLELRRRGQPVPKSKLVDYMRRTGKSTPNPNKQKKRKRCRYEREHSGSLVHGDAHRTSENHPYVIAWIDDASRKILAGAEFPSLSAEHALETFKEARKNALEQNVLILQVNTDRGTEFYNSKSGKPSLLTGYLVENGMEHIPSRVKNPQTNGKIERFWLEYDRHRWRFSSLEEFFDWYNGRLHGALDTSIGECPREAFVRKATPEANLGMFVMLAGW